MVRKRFAPDQIIQHLRDAVGGSGGFVVEPFAFG